MGRGGNHGNLLKEGGAHVSFVCDGRVIKHDYRIALPPLQAWRSEGEETIKAQVGDCGPDPQSQPFERRLVGTFFCQYRKVGNCSMHSVSLLPEGEVWAAVSSGCFTQLRAYR
jgi:hypothetical protein